MKKYLSSILLFALLIISACQDDIIPIVDDGTKDGTEVTSPIFHVSIAGDDVRTQLNSSLKLEWVAGDKIAIKCGNAKAIYTTNDSGTDVDFVPESGDELPSEGPFEAYYPASLADNAVLPAEQTYVANNISSFPMRAVSNDTKLSFKHLCGILELNLSTSDSGIKVGGISLESTEGMSGVFTLNGDAAQMGTDAGNVNMEIADSLALSGTAAKIYLAVPEGTYAAGMRYIVKTNKGWRVFTSNKALTFTRAHITPADLTVAAAKLYKFRTSNDAKQNWTYTNSIMAATTTNVTESDKSKCFVEMLADFNQTAQLVISNKKFTFDGLGHTIAVSSLTVATSIYPQSGSDVTFKDVTILGPGTSSTHKNRAMAFESGNTVTLDNCVIKDFKDSNNGGALWVQGALVVTGKSRIENCCATGTYGGGAIFCENGTVTIEDDVTISGCTATSHAGAIYMYGKGSLTIGSATIKNCSATNNGGAIICGNAVSGVGSTITITGATISDCGAAYGGCLSATCGTSTFNKVTISGCTNKTSGGSFYMTGGTVTLNNSSVSGGNTYITTAGTFNFNNSEYIYSNSAGNAIYMIGTSATHNGKINIAEGSVITSAGTDVYATYGVVSIENSSIISNAKYCLQLDAGATATCTNVNAASLGTEIFYVNITDASQTPLTVSGGYYYAKNRISGSNGAHIKVTEGYFSNNLMSTATTYSGCTLTGITPVNQEIGGNEYSFPWHAASTPALSNFHNPSEVIL